MRMRLDAEDTVCAPEIIDLEVANAWRRRCLALDVSAKIALDWHWTISPSSAVWPGSPHRPLMPRIWELRHNLTPYDAAYVALAEALDATLLTVDGRSTRAPSLRCEVELIQ